MSKRVSDGGWHPNLKSRGETFAGNVKREPVVELDPATWRERLRNPWRWIMTVTQGGRSRLEPPEE